MSIADEIEESLDMELILRLSKESKLVDVPTKVFWSETDKQDKSLEGMELINTGFYHDDEAKNLYLEVMNSSDRYAVIIKSMLEDRARASIREMRSAF